MSINMSENKGNPDQVLPMATAAIAGLVLAPTYPLLGGGILFAVGAWGIRYYREHSKLAGVFRNCGLVNRDGQVLQLRASERIPGGRMYRYSLPPGLCTADVEKHIDATEQFLGKDVVISVSLKDVVVEAYDEPIAQYTYEFTGALELGRGRGQTPIILDLARFPHLLIAGETGSGKSTLLRALIVSMILLGYRVHLVDLKAGTEFGILRHRAASFARTQEDAEMRINLFAEMVEARYEEFYQSGVVSRKLTPEVLFIDEFSELTDKATMRQIMRIAAIGRAASCYVVIATQRPSADVITGTIKNNLTNVVGLKTQNDINSRIILDRGCLERLRGHGHGIYKCGGEFVEFQAPYLSEERAKEMLA